jgi:predicted ATPase/DNA-binding XRE family transcriptional regulator
LLRDARLAKGLSQEELAENARVSVDAISALERGRRKTPQRQTLEMLLDALAPRADVRARLEAAAGRSLPTVSSDRDESYREAPARAPGVGNYVRPLTAFFGREKELNSLAELTKQYPLVTITGSGGVGKTRAASELAWRIAERYPDGGWFVELGPLRDAALVPKAIAAALNIAEQTDLPLVERVVTVINGKALLVVLDNCEHVIDAAARAAHTILTRCENVTIVATSREALRIAGEATYQLPTLDTPPAALELSPESAMRYSSVALLAERVRARTRAFDLQPHNLAAAAEICRRLDGIPLAIELAAAKTSVLSLRQIAERLNERFSLLTDGSRTSLPRQQTLRALIDWSFDLLTPREQSLFSRLSVFAGAFSVGAAEAVTAFGDIGPEDVLPMLASLVDKSLVLADPTGSENVRFRLLETTREYAQSRLHEAGDLERTLALHAAYILAFVRGARGQLQEMTDSAWLEMVHAEIDNVRAALEWTLRDGNDVAVGAEICAMIGFYWDSRSWDEGTRWLTSARALIDDLEPRLAALVLQEFVRIQPTSDETFELAKQSLQTYRSIDDQAGIASALEYLGQTLINLGRYGTAVIVLEEGVAAARQARHTASTLRTLIFLAVAHLYAGDRDTAVARLAAAEQLRTPKTHLRDVALLLRCETEIALAGGDWPRAVAVSETTLEVAERTGDRRGIGIAQYLRAQALACASRFAEARRHASAAIASLSNAQLPFHLAEAQLVAAAVYERLHADESAVRMLGFARSRAENLAYQSGFLISDFFARSVETALERVGAARFDAFAGEGAALDSAWFSATLDAPEGGPSFC